MPPVRWRTRVVCQFCCGCALCVPLRLDSQIFSSTFFFFLLGHALRFSTAQSALRSIAVSALAETLAAGDDGGATLSLALAADLDSPDFVDGDSPTTPELVAADAAARKRRKERKRAARKGSKSGGTGSVGGGSGVAEAEMQSATRIVRQCRLLYFPYIVNTPEVRFPISMLCLCFLLLLLCFIRVATFVSVVAIFFPFRSGRNVSRR